jgi:NhaC family Na+:H+ antiporter
MLFSCISAFSVAVFVQNFEYFHILKSLLTGFTIENGNKVSEIIHGGGVSFMLNPMLVVSASSAFSALLQKVGVIGHFEPAIRKIAKKTGNFTASFITGLLTAAVGCSQTLAVILSINLTKNHYRISGESNERLALDTEDSVILLSPLIPWNISVSIPLNLLESTAISLPFAFFLYLLPISRILYETIKRTKHRSTTSLAE